MFAAPFPPAGLDPRWGHSCKSDPWYLAAEACEASEPFPVPLTAEVVSAKVTVRWATASDISSKAWVLRLPTIGPGYAFSMAA